MKARRWSVVLAILFGVVLAWYLFYTRQLVSAMNADAAAMSRMAARVFSGLSDPRVSGDDILFITKNCPNGDELCSELNVFNQKTGILTQLTYFGRDSLISSPRIDAGRIAFRRDSWAFQSIDEAYVGFETPEPLCGTLSRTGGLDAGVNLALVFAPLAIAPWLHRRLIRRRRGITMTDRSGVHSRENG